ncbi:MAG: hypothetical protein KKG06_06545 [Bacteroidetes bacterium]|nr:hypothetical protein [Bacteroidota bacterium]
MSGQLNFTCLPVYIRQLTDAGRSVNGNEVDIPIFRDEGNIFMSIPDILIKTDESGQDYFFCSFPDKIL